VKAVAQERSGWRDKALSERHRKWGWDAPFVDFDGIEYDDGKPLFMVEYKHELAPPVSPQASNVRALCAVGDRADLPFFIVRYGSAPDWWFIVRPANKVAKKLRDLPQGRISERDYVLFRYRFAGRTPPSDVLDQFAAPARFLTPEEIGRCTEEDLREVGRQAFGINYEEDRA
jgi:hypothetical protein